MITCTQDSVHPGLQNETASAIINFFVLQPVTNPFYRKSLLEHTFAHEWKLPFSFWHNIVSNFQAFLFLVQLVPIAPGRTVVRCRQHWQWQKSRGTVTGVVVHKIIGQSI
jgi:hypothetical protein